MMESKKSVKSEEKSSEKKTPETSEEDPIGLKETCPLQNQTYMGGDREVHCRTDCAWYSDDHCIVWDLVAVLRRLASDKTVEGTLKIQR